MSAFAQDHERRLVPRWRFSDAPTNPFEFASDPRKERSEALNRAFLDEKLFDWGHKQTIGNAIDLVSCGVSGRWLDDVQPAAEFLLKHGTELSPRVVALAERAMDMRSEESGLIETGQSRLPAMTWGRACARVASARQRLHRDPRNVLAWLDLSRAYVILGERDKAIECIERALYLAPNHRQVLRSAVRLFIYTEQKGRAHSLLLRNPRTRQDPWLIAAEIAAAKIADKNPRFIRQGRTLADSSGLPPAYITELQSALGTAEFYGGANRKAKQRFQSSLAAPTDNSLAQARWIRTQLPGIHIDERAFNLPLGFEARSWRALEQSLWEQAQSECDLWLTDEPYSSRPATLGSYIGISLTNDFPFAERCARTGLTADSEEETLRNNLTVALAYQGKLDDALTEFSKIATPPSSDLPVFVYIATAGLLQFRLGHVDSGRELYEKAEQLAPKARRHRVTIFRAREEISAGTDQARQQLQRALDYKPKRNDMDTAHLQALLKLQAESIDDESDSSVRERKLLIPRT